MPAVQAHLNHGDKTDACLVTTTTTPTTQAATTTAAPKVKKPKKQKQPKQHSQALSAKTKHSSHSTGTSRQKPSNHGQAKKAAAHASGGQPSNAGGNGKGK
jgi:hypothetical protein